MLGFILFIFLILGIGSLVLFLNKSEPAKKIKTILQKILENLKALFENLKQLFVLIQELIQEDNSQSEDLGTTSQNNPSSTTETNRDENDLIKSVLSTSNDQSSQEPLIEDKGSVLNQADDSNNEEVNKQ